MRTELGNSECNTVKENEFIETSYRLKELEKLEKLLNNEEFSDVTITANGKNFYLNKCILISSSDVFEAMFKNDLKENKQISVEINDINSEVLGEFFQFIYTGKFKKFMEIVGELLIAAEKYNVKSLKALCEEKMCKNLTKDNAIEYIKLAVMNDAEKLKTHAENLISVHLDYFTHKPEFREFGIKYPEVLLDLMKNCFCVKK